MRILVTGSNGFIASSLINKLLTENHEILGLDIIETQKRPNSKYFTHLVADITNPKIEDYGVMWKDIDFCFHLAAMANVDEVREQREKAFQINIHGTFNIVEMCRKYNIPLAFASTACVYGATTEHPSTENSPTFPVDWYGVTKRTGEELVKGLLKKYVILRFGTTFGSNMRDALCTSIFLKQAINGEKFTIKGDGFQSRNFIYIDDLVDGCIKAMEFLRNKSLKNEKVEETFNLVGLQSETIHNLACICHLIVHGKTPSLIMDNQVMIYLPPRPDDIVTEDISIEKAYRILGWTPKTGLYWGMKKIYDEWKTK